MSIHGTSLTQGTDHVLVNRFDNSEKTFKWTGRGWGSHGFSSPPKVMIFAGWSYGSPAHPPIPTRSPKE